MAGWEPDRFNWRRVLSAPRFTPRPSFLVAFGFAGGIRFGVLWLGNLLLQLLGLIVAIELIGVWVTAARRERKRLRTYRAAGHRGAHQ
jgi:Flp pilus assembly protein TadB